MKPVKILGILNLRKSHQKKPIWIIIESETTFGT